MSVSLDFLVKVLQLELKEVEHDLNGLKDLYSNRHDSSEITNYVFLENTAVLQSELDSIHQIGTILDNINIDEKHTPHELLDSIDEYLKIEISKRQFSEAIYNFVKSKLAKVSKYLDM
jgi:SUMO ligase MMS21 Smc5/6 complex component